MIYRSSHYNIGYQRYLLHARREIIKPPSSFLPLPFVDLGGSTANVWSYISTERLQNSNKMHASADSKILSLLPFFPSHGKIAADGRPVREGPPPTQLVASSAARSSHIIAQVALRRKQHKHNAVEPRMSHTRRTYALTHAIRTYARVIFAYVTYRRAGTRRKIIYAT